MRLARKAKAQAPFFKTCAVADGAPNYRVPQRLFRGVVGKRQVGLGEGSQDHVTVVEEFAHDITQHRVVIHLMRFAHRTGDAVT